MRTYLPHRAGDWLFSTLAVKDELVFVTGRITQIFGGKRWSLMLVTSIKREPTE